MDERYLKNISKHLKNFKKHFKKNQYDADYLFNETTTSNNNISAIEEARNLFNEHKSNLFRKETNEIRKKLHKKEAIYNFLKEQKLILTDRQKRVLKNIDRYLKNFKKDLEKLQKYQYNITYGLDYLFNELNKSKGDKDNKLATYKYFDIIRP